MNNGTTKLVLVLLILAVPILTNGQSKKEIIEDAWWYLDTFENFKLKENIELIKNWDDEKVFCLVSFEKGFFTINGETSNEQEKESFIIEETGDKMFLVVSNHSGLIYKFEVMAVDKNK